MPSLNATSVPRRASRLVDRLADVGTESAAEVKRNEAVKMSVLENACSTLHGEIESLGSMLHDLERRLEPVRRPAEDADGEAVGRPDFPACSVAVRNVYDATEKIRQLQARIRGLIDHLDT